MRGKEEEITSASADCFFECVLVFSRDARQKREKEKQLSIDADQKEKKSGNARSIGKNAQSFLSLFFLAFRSKLTSETAHPELRDEEDVIARGMRRERGYEEE